MQDKIVITPHGDIEDTTINDEEETETKLDTFHPLSIMVNQEDFRNQKGNQLELEKESNVSTRDMITNTEVGTHYISFIISYIFFLIFYSLKQGKYYLASKEQSLETIGEIDITKTKAAEDEVSQLI